MDDLSIDIESLVLDRGTERVGDAVAAAIRAQTGEALDVGVLAEVSRAVIESVRDTVTTTG